MMADSSRPVTGGVDTHKDVHVAAAVDRLGAVLGTSPFSNDQAGHQSLWRWLQSYGNVERVGVEGTGSWGAGLSRLLIGEGVTVIEVNRPNRAARRRSGKSDTVDAIEAARSALSGQANAIAKTGDGIIEAIRILRTARRSAVQSRTQSANQIHALVDTAPQTLRERWARCSFVELVSVAEHLEVDTILNHPNVCAPWTLGVLTDRWTYLDNQIAQLDGQLDQLVPLAAPTLIAQFGVGTDTAGALLVAAGDNPERLHSEAAFAALCGVAPLQASSGRTTRHRLNRGGNRDANNALWRITMVRMAHDPTTKAYVQRRTTEGRSKREIIRILKRYIARQLFPHLQHLASTS